ncbi:hypothetical protein [Fluviicola sp.]|uniref:hypothetical protein n=1 Tax=Fluviicola sp. TaxID=1917219 RepID=UPI0031DAD1EA
MIKLTLCLIGGIVSVSNTFATTEQSITETPKTDLLDSIITIAIILFIVSMIVEKMTQFVRSYGPGSWIAQLFSKLGIKGIWKNIGKGQKPESIELKNKIEREVAMLSFVIGLIIASSLGIDILSMFQANDPREVIFWKGSQYPHKIILILSLILTAFFLSFGSKFFHDLLDMLLQIKNLKRKLASDETYDVETVEQLDTYLTKSQSEIVHLAIEQNKELFHHKELTSTPMHGKLMKNDELIDCIDIHISGSDRGKIPISVNADIGKGKRVNIPVNVIFRVETASVYVGQNSAVFVAERAGVSGSLCCKIRIGSEERLLTCSHVLNAGKGVNRFGAIKPTPAMIDGKLNGNFVWALHDKQFDIALIKTTTSSFTYEITPNKVKKLTHLDIRTLQVRIMCNDTLNGGYLEKKGYVINNRTINPIPIKYSDGTYQMTDLIVLSNIKESESDDNYSGITTPGDSGACVYDQYNNPIGMIIAGNNKFSYAIPLVNILNKLSAEIV